VVGAPQSGKSTVVQTLVMAASLTHSPEQVQFYCLDFSGGALLALRDVPHVGSVAAGRDDDRIRRTIALITNLIAARQSLFAELGIDTMREFRRRRNLPGEGQALAARDSHGDVFLMIDGWDIGFSTTGRYFEEYMGTMESIALQGLNYGVHLVITSSRWAAVRPAIKDLVTTRIEMRLGDLTDTVFNMHRAMVAAVPVNRPGRCISSDGLHMLSALPRIDGSGDPTTVGQGLAAAIAHLNALYPGRRAPEVRLLPERISLDRVRAHWPAAGTLAERLVVPFGVRESDLTAAAIDFGVSTHLIVLGSSGSGKSTVLATLLESIRRQYDQSQARVFLIDYRRRHMDAIAPEMLINHVTNERDLTRELPAIIGKMQSRRAPDGVTARQLAERSWWSGPEVFIVIEDYHMVVQRGAMNPLDPLKDIIVDGRDTGLHVIAARNSAQASTALFDMVLGQMKNLNSSGIILDGDKSEGALVGDVKAAKQPPGRGYFVEPMYGRKDLVQVAVPDELSP
jgi:S-DNA-T family DNA segregation ATPase FtsK/SpoIIIE